MPYTINGIGSWYYGKKNDHTRDGTCEFCGAHTQLKSYDTTKFFVLIFVPILPLGEKRVIDECTHCKNHRVISLKEWGRLKEQSMDSLYTKWVQEPNNIENTIDLLGSIAYYRDIDRLNSVAPDIRTNCGHNAEIMNQLGLVHLYFNQLEEAEAAFNASLSIKQDREVSENLAEALMKNLKPDQAKPLITHITAEKIIDKIYYVFLLIESYQYIGEHISALEVIEECENAFPGMKGEKALRTYRRKSERYHDKPHSVKGSLICAKTSNKNSKGLSFLLPKLIPLALITLILTIYVLSAYFIGLSREVYLVNGLDISYSVEVNGERVDIQPMSRKMVKLPEGTIKVNVLYLDTIEKNMEASINTPFWSRPFNKPILVINPDKVAVFLWQETEYVLESEENTDYEPPYRYYTGRFFYNLNSVDYLFKEFPESIMLREGNKETKTQFIQLDDSYLSSYYMYILNSLSPEDALSYAKSRLIYEPDDEMNTYVFLSYCDKDSDIDFLKTRLAQRPVVVNWHRTYQVYMETYKPSYDLEEEYSNYLENEKDNNALNYLLSRILDDPKRAESLLLKSIEGSDPCPYGYYGLAYQRLSEGNFEQALPFAQKAVEALPEQITFDGILESAMMAQGEYDSLLLKNKSQQDNNPHDGELVAEEIRLHMYKGDSDSAKNAISNYLTRIGQNDKELAQTWSSYLNGVLAYCSDDHTAYSIAIEGFQEPQFAFESAFIKGDYNKASTIARDNGFDGSYYLLLYLAEDNPDDATQYLEQAIGVYKNGSKTDRLLADYLSGTGNFGIEELKSIVMPPETKHIAMAALGKLNPSYQKELFALAKKLNYEKRFPYHFIEKVVGNN